MLITVLTDKQEGSVSKVEALSHVNFSRSVLY